MAYCWYYASTCLHDFFSIHLNPRCIHLVPPLNCWVVQMPAREKSSKWKYKDDEGGKKDAEKEKTRSREQESSMNHTMNEWKFQCGLWLNYFQNPHYLIMFFLVHTSACNVCTFSGALAPQPPRQVESRKMQRLLPETAMKELHSQAPGGNEVETIRRHLAFGCFGGVAKIDSIFLNCVFIQLHWHVNCVCVFLCWMYWKYLVIVKILWCIPRPSLSMAYRWYIVDVSTLSSRLLFDSFEPSLYPSSAPP